MTTCNARLPIGERPRATVAPSGGVAYVQRRCTQSVGLVRIGPMFGCLRRGHREDVVAQVGEMWQRARHEREQDARSEALAEIRRDDRAAACLDDEWEPVESIDEAYG